MTDKSRLEANIRKYEEASRDGKIVYLDVDDLIDIADYYDSNNDTPKALEVADYAAKLFPGATLPLCFKARGAIASGDIEMAERYAEEIEEKDDVEYTYLKAEIFLARGETSAADMLLAEEYDGTVDEEKDLLVYDATEMFFDYEEYDLARKWLNKSNNKDDTEYKELLSKIAVACGQFAESQKILNHLLDTDPFSLKYWNMLASSQFLSNDIPNSLESADFALAIDNGDAEATLIKANALYTLDNIEEALAYFERYNTLMHGSEIGELFVGSCLSHLRRYDDAIMHLEKAAAMCHPSSPTLLHIYRELVVCYNYIHDFDKAVSCTEKAKQHPECDKSEILLLKGLCYISKGDKKMAEDYINAAIEEANPDQLALILINAAATALDNKYPETAYRLLITLLGKDSETEHHDGWGYFALACFQLNKTDEFLYGLQKVCRYNPGEARVTLAKIFPEGLPVEDYVAYYKNNFLK